MTAVNRAPIPWSRRRWLVFFLLAILAQLALVFRLSDSSVVTLGFPHAGTRIRVLPDFQNGSGAQAALSESDPTLFALVTPHGFSDSAWLTIPRFDYEMTNHLEPPQWLAPPIDELVDDFDDFVQSNVVAEETMVGRIPPVFSRVLLPEPVVTTGALVKAEGPLVSRMLPAQPALPPPPSGQIPTNTVVRVAVDIAGLPRSVALVVSSGVAAADQSALAYAKKARFAPVSMANSTDLGTETGLTFGNLVFQWFQVRPEVSPLATGQR